MKLLQKILFGAAVVVAGGTLYAGPSDDVDARLNAKMGELDTQVRGDLDHIVSLQAIARKQQDVIKLSCVNDRYVKAKAGANIFDNARVDLASSHDEESRTRATASLNSATDTVHTAREEADRCVGSTEIQSDANTSYTKPDVPYDPTVGGLPLGGGQTIEPPTYSTPFH